MLQKRKYQRYPVSAEGALALVGGIMSKIIDISKGGLSLMFLEEMDMDIPEELSLDLLSTQSNLKAIGIPGKFTWEDEVSFSDVSGIVYKKIGLQFGKLSSEQREKIDTLIVDYVSACA